jgi:hypothetical protein
MTGYRKHKSIFALFGPDAAKSEKSIGCGSTGRNRKTKSGTRGTVRETLRQQKFLTAFMNWTSGCAFD